MALPSRNIISVLSSTSARFLSIFHCLWSFNVQNLLVCSISRRFNFMYVLPDKNADAATRAVYMEHSNLWADRVSNFSNAEIVRVGSPCTTGMSVNPNEVRMASVTANEIRSKFVKIPNEEQQSERSKTRATAFNILVWFMYVWLNASIRTCLAWAKIKLS